MTYQNIKAELKRVGATYGDAASLLRMTRENFGLKVNGRVPFTVPEIKTIRDRLMPDATLDYLTEEEVVGCVVQHIHHT